MSAENSKVETKEITVKEKLKALYDLQLVVSEIDKIKTLRGELPLEVQDLEDEIAGLETRIENIRAELKECETTIAGRKNDIENIVFVMIPDEYRQVVESDKFTGIKVIQVLPYPNGEPGFYFVRMQYADNFDDLLAEEKAARRMLQEEVLSRGQVLGPEKSEGAGSALWML